MAHANNKGVDSNANKSFLTAFQWKKYRFAKKYCVAVFKNALSYGKQIALMIVGIIMNWALDGWLLNSRPRYRTTTLHPTYVKETAYYMAEEYWIGLAYCSASLDFETSDDKLENYLHCFLPHIFAFRCTLISVSSLLSDRS